MHNYINRSSEVRNYRPDSKVMNSVQEQQHREQLAIDDLATAMTPSATIQSWSRELLESAFTQRELQLSEAVREVHIQKALIDQLKAAHDH